MISTEDRLRAAAQAAASTVAPGSAPPLHLPTEPGRAPARLTPTRRRGWRWAAAPLAAAAAVLAVLAASLALAHSAPGDRPAPPGRTLLAGIPAYYVALIGKIPLPANASRQYAVVRATATGKVLATIRPPAPYHTIEYVTAAADDRTFVLAAGRGKITHHDGATTIHDSPVKFFLLKLSPTGHVARLTALPIPAQQQPSAISLAPDGRRLAVATNHVRDRQWADATIGVFSLPDGHVRTWVWPRQARFLNLDVTNQQLMSWTADGRVLAFEQWLRSNEQVRLLDTSAPGTDLRASTLALTFSHQADSGQSTRGRAVDALEGYNALITPDGTKIIAGTATVTKHPATYDGHFTVFSAKTGSALRELHQSVRRASYGGPQDVQWVSPSGSALIGSIMDPGNRTVMGIIRGDHFTPLPGDFAAVAALAW
jgi:hypothetical protein